MNDRGRKAQESVVRTNAFGEVLNKKGWKGFIRNFEIKLLETLRLGTVMALRKYTDDKQID